MQTSLRVAAKTVFPFSSYFEVSEEEEYELTDDVIEDADADDHNSYKPKNGFSKSFSNTSSWSDASSIGSCG